MSRMFVDPRTDQDPASPRPPVRFTADEEELAELQRLCREGRLYDVERWIAAGRPLQLEPGARINRRRFQTALEVALDRRDHSLALLLLVNGYDPEAEPECPLDAALRSRRKDILELLLAWGADPRRVSTHAVCDTYDSEIFERFREVGLDLTADHALARALGYTASNKPLFGFAKRHRLEDPGIQTDLDIALAYHADEGNEKGALLCLWAGADPHAPVPDLERLRSRDEDDDLYSAIYRACGLGSVGLLERMGPDPALDDYDELFRCAPDASTFELLLRSARPVDPSGVVRLQLARLGWGWEEYRPLEALRVLFAAGVRWESGTSQEIRETRRDLLKTDDWTFLEVMRLLASGEHCSAEVLTELARTAAIRKRMKETGLIPASRRHRSAYRRRPEQAREILARMGIEVQAPRVGRKEKPPLPKVLRIGPRHRKGEVRMSRAELYERVWSQPVESLGEQWSLSGRGLARACKRLRVPVPPRGYWARVKAGQQVRRPTLPALPSGQGEEVIVMVPEMVEGP